MKVREPHLVDGGLADHSYGMGQHKEEDLARWRGPVSEQAASGRSAASFCRDHDLRIWQFYEWKKRLRPSEAAPFIAVEVGFYGGGIGTASGDVRGRDTASPWLERDREPGFDASHLRRLLTVLEMAS
jgi:hypothetical protein